MLELNTLMEARLQDQKAHAGHKMLLFRTFCCFYTLPDLSRLTRGYEYKESVSSLSTVLGLGEVSEVYGFYRSYYCTGKDYTLLCTLTLFVGASIFCALQLETDRYAYIYAAINLLIL